MASPVLANTASQISGKTLVTTTDTQVLSGPITFQRAPNPPFAVQAGSANVPNLDADLLQGLTPAQIIANATPIPSGTIAMFAGPSGSIPTGWTWCNGQAISRTTFAALFAAIGTTFGAGDGLTTFNVPDHRQRFPLGVAASGTGNALGQTGGAVDHTHTYSQVINHTHTVSVTDPGHDHTTNGIPQHFVNNNLGGSGEAFVINDGVFVSVGTATTGISATTSNPGGGAASGTTTAQNPPYLALHFMIKQ